MPKNFNFFLILKFQCKHSHEYSGVLFDVFTDCTMCPNAFHQGKQGPNKHNNWTISQKEETFP